MFQHDNVNGYFSFNRLSLLPQSHPHCCFSCCLLSRFHSAILNLSSVCLFPFPINKTFYSLLITIPILSISLVQSLARIFTPTSLSVVNSETFCLSLFFFTFVRLELLQEMSSKTPRELNSPCHIWNSLIFSCFCRAALRSFPPLSLLYSCCSSHFSYARPPQGIRGRTIFQMKQLMPRS